MSIPHPDAPHRKVWEKTTQTHIDKMMGLLHQSINHVDGEILEDIPGQEMLLTAYALAWLATTLNRRDLRASYDQWTASHEAAKEMVASSEQELQEASA